MPSLCGEMGEHQSSSTKKSTPRSGTFSRRIFRPGRLLAMLAILMPLPCQAQSVAPAITSTAASQSAQPPVERPQVAVSQRALDIHSRSYVFDGHNDLPWVVRTEASRSFDALDISKPQPKIHTDIPRLRAGGVGAQFWSVFVPVDTISSGTAHQTTIEQIEIVKAMIQKYPETFALALDSDDVLRIRQDGKIASLIGMEGGHAIENSIEKLRRLHAMGARYMTLTHSDTLDWADSCSDEPKSNGLSDFGKEVVREMNRLGMLVDISHVSPATMQATLDTTIAPIIFSHSSARAIAEHPRNVPDEILKQLPANGGIVMVNFFSGFIVPESANNTRTMFERRRQLKAKFGSDADAVKKEMAAYELKFPTFAGSVHHIADHIEHIAKVAGIDHVGIGSDFDGIDVCPKQMEDVSKYPVLTQVLLDRGFSESDIHKVMSGNILRVMKQVESKRQK